MDGEFARVNIVGRVVDKHASAAREGGGPVTRLIYAVKNKREEIKLLFDH